MPISNQPEPYVLTMSLVPGRRYRLSFVMKRVADGLVIDRQVIEPVSKFIAYAFDMTAALPFAPAPQSKIKNRKSKIRT